MNSPSPAVPPKAQPDHSYPEVVDKNYPIPVSQPQPQAGHFEQTPSSAQVSQYTYGADPRYQSPSTTYGQQYPEPKEDISKKGGRICGLRKVTFWLVVVASILLVGVIAAAAAAGVAASKSNNNNSNAAQSGTPTPTPTSSSSASTTSPPQTTLSLPTPSSNPSLPLGAGVVSCPVTSANATYSPPGTSLTFTRSCNGDNFPGADLGHLPMTRMEDCMNWCALFNVNPQSPLGPCVGVVWIYGGRQGTSDNFCWLKYAKGAPDTNFTEPVETAWLNS